MSGDLAETIADLYLLVEGLVETLRGSTSEIHRGIGDAMRYSQAVVFIGAHPDNPDRIRAAIMPGFAPELLCPAVVATALRTAADDLEADIARAGVSCAHQHDGSPS